jgi:hypothetical protein
VNAPAGQLNGLAIGSIIFTDPVGSSPVNSGPVDINRLGIAEWQPSTALGSVYPSCLLTSSPAGATQLPTCSIPASVDIETAAAATAPLTISSTASTTAAASILPGHDHGVWIAATAVWSFLDCVWWEA